MIHIAICDDEKYMSDHIKTMASDFFCKKNREIPVSRLRSREFSSVVLQYMKNI